MRNALGSGEDCGKVGEHVYLQRHGCSHPSLLLPWGHVGPVLSKHFTFQDHLYIWIFESVGKMPLFLNYGNSSHSYWNIFMFTKNICRPRQHKSKYGCRQNLAHGPPVWDLSYETNTDQKSGSRVLGETCLRFSYEEADRLGEFPGRRWCGSMKVLLFLQDPTWFCGYS